MQTSDLSEELIFRLQLRQEVQLSPTLRHHQQNVFRPEYFRRRSVTFPLLSLFPYLLVKTVLVSSKGNRAVGQ